MPGVKDFAALPTSWALTMWDALPLFLAVEAALAILMLALISPRLGRLSWEVAARLLVGGGAYLLAFSSSLILPFIALSLALVYTESRKAEPDNDDGLPTIRAGLLTRAWDVVGAVAYSAALAAGIKALLIPYVPHEHLAWFPIALVIGLIPAGTFGVVVIPALAVTTATGSVVAGTLVLGAAATRPFLIDRVVARQPAQQGAD